MVSFLIFGLENVQEAAANAGRTIIFSIDSMIYGLISILYSMFSRLCSGRLLDSTVLKEIGERVGLFVGIIMLFIIIINFIKYLVNPDTLTDNKVGAVAIIRRVLVVIVLLGTSSFIFNFLYSVQSSVVSNNVIEKLLLPYTVSIGSPDDTTQATNDQGRFDGSQNGMDKFGGVLAEELFSVFYYQKDIANSGDLTDDSESMVEACEYAQNAFRTAIVEDNDFELGKYCLNATVTSETGGVETTTNLMKYDWFSATICGLIVIFLLFMYCFKIGIRMVQLMFLEIISPAPIISYVSPDGKMFNTWLKIYIATYIDVFIRIAIVNFVVFLIATVFNSAGDGFVFWSTVGDPSDPGVKGFFTVIIVLGLLGFAHKAPDLIKSLLPESASKLGFGGVTMKDFFGLGAAVGATAGAGMELLHVNPIGMIGGAIRGGRAGHGAKNLVGAIGAGGKAERDHRNMVREIRANSGNYLGYLGNQLASSLGYQTTAQEYDERIHGIEQQIESEKETVAVKRRQSSAYGQISDIKGKIESRAEDKLLHGDLHGKNDKIKNQQKRLLALQNEITAMKESGKYSAAEITKKEQFFFAAKEYAKKGYISEVFKDASQDGAMSSMIATLNNVTEINADGAFNGMNTVLKDYKSLDDLESASTQRNNNNNLAIAQSDARVAQYEGEISSIKNSVGYRAAQANKPKK